MLALAQPRPAAAESLTLTTYYPAPYGTYLEMRTTRDVYLAYGQASDKVGIGTTQAMSKLSVSGSAAVGDGFETSDQSANPGGLIVRGRVGVGTPYPYPGDNTHPAYALDVAGSARFTRPVRVGTTGCYPMAASGIGYTYCPLSSYATFTSGLYVEGFTYVGIPSVFKTTVKTGLFAQEMETTADVTFMCCPRK
ncbi:MAG: hypothetical protein WC728_09835 [Elusimicrobiota bacterium]